MNNASGKQSGWLGRGFWTPAALSARLRSGDWKRPAAIAAGLAAFAAIRYPAPWPEIAFPGFAPLSLTPDGQTALALAALALIWWGFEIAPIGATSLAVGAAQAILGLRSPGEALSDFFHPAIWFVLGSLALSMAATKSGLTRRLAYRMLAAAGESATRITIVCFVTTVGLTLFIPHTVVAASVFPLLMAVCSLYDDKGAPSRFGKGLFIGLAFGAGVGSIVTLFGSARAALAVGFFEKMTGHEISFFEISYYSAPLAAAAGGLILLLLLILYRPEKKAIAGLGERSRLLYQRLGPLSSAEAQTAAIIAGVSALLILRSFEPALRPWGNSAILLVGVFLLFLLRLLTVKELEELPWNMILLFGGALSLGFCLWQTGAAQWLGAGTALLFRGVSPFAFLLALSLFTVILTNFVMNLVAVTIILPLAVAAAPYLALSAETVFFCVLTAAGMPFLLLIGAAPNAIAFESRQFTPREFFRTGLAASLLLLATLALFVAFVWPSMGLG